ncbi:MAG: ribbon-helix-helix protein, CopG family [Planctomycetota bacterium]|jgi:hypothetical protein
MANEQKPNQVSTVVDDKTLAFLTTLADRQGRSIASVIRQAVLEMIERTGSA